MNSILRKPDTLTLNQFDVMDLQKMQETLQLVRSSVCPSKVFRSDTITQIVFIVQLSNAVHSYLTTQERRLQNLKSYHFVFPFLFQRLSLHKCLFNIVKKDIIPFKFYVHIIMCQTFKRIAMQKLSIAIGRGVGAVGLIVCHALGMVGV